MRVIYRGDEHQLPVAVRVVDKHGSVAVLRVTPAGNAFFRQVRMSKGHLRAQEQGWPPEMHDQVRDIREAFRVFLDEVEDDELPTYCSKGKHQVTLPIDDLRRMAEEFKAGHPVFTLSL